MVICQGRVLSLCLQGDQSVTWAEALQSEQILSRILWIVENALNPLLIERVNDSSMSQSPSNTR